jgi:pyridoxal phosphate enzyme (YggS family)
MTIASSLEEIRERMARAAHRAGRAPDEIALMAVSKTHPAEAIREAMAAGQVLFGENRVQEFAVKREELERLPSWSVLPSRPSSDGASQPGTQQQTPLRLWVPSARFHLIGHLQSNKAARAAELFDAIDSVDSLRLAERLNEAAARLKRKLDVLIEINIGGEAAKSGVEPESAELPKLLEAQGRLGNLTIRGFMTVPPFTPEPEGARVYFRRLRQLREQLRASSGLGLEELSMGMSQDFEVAIEEGSSCVRVGTAIFGARPYRTSDEEPSR